MDPVGNTNQRPIISQEAWRRFLAELKSDEDEYRATLPPEEQKELADRDARLESTAGFQQVGESGE